MVSPRTIRSRKRRISQNEMCRNNQNGWANLFNLNARFDESGSILGFALGGNLTTLLQRIWEAFKSEKAEHRLEGLRNNSKGTSKEMGNQSRKTKRKRQTEQHRQKNDENSTRVTARANEHGETAQQRNETKRKTTAIEIKGRKLKR